MTKSDIGKAPFTFSGKINKDKEQRQQAEMHGTLEPAALA